MMEQGRPTIEQMEVWVRGAVDRHGDDGDRFALSGILEDRDRLRSQLASLIDLIRRRYPRLLERGNPMYDGLLADAVRGAEDGGALNQADNEIGHLRARVAELEKQPRANELRALRNLFAAAGRTIHTASAGGRATLEEINDAWAEVCAAHVANRDLPAPDVAPVPMEAQAAAQGVVPGLTDEEVDAYLWDRNHGLVDSDEDWVRWSRRVGRWAYALAVSRLPASRVLRDGEERIGAEELAVLREVVRLVAEARERYDKRPRGAGGQRMPDEIDDLLCRLYEMGAHPASRVPRDREARIGAEELAALRCLDDAVTINGDGMSTEALGVNWEVARSAKRRLANIRAAKGGEE